MTEQLLYARRLWRDANSKEPPRAEAMRPARAPAMQRIWHCLRALAFTSRLFRQVLWWSLWPSHGSKVDLSSDRGAVLPTPAPDVGHPLPSRRRLPSLVLFSWPPSPLNQRLPPHFPPHTPFPTAHARFDHTSIRTPILVPLSLCAWPDQRWPSLGGGPRRRRRGAIPLPTHPQAEFRGRRRPPPCAPALRRHAIRSLGLGMARCCQQGRVGWPRLWAVLLVGVAWRCWRRTYKRDSARCVSQ